MTIREATTADLYDLLEVEEQAFGDAEGPEIVRLVRALLDDPTAKPLLSLVAVDEQRIIGHILFTAASLDSDKSIETAILAPLAVAPAFQRTGVGGRLVKAGLTILADRGITLAFVLGHPDYYPRHGFIPASPLGFEPPYPIPEEVADAWMVQELKPGLIGGIRGKVLCAAALDRPEYWRE